MSSRIGESSILRMSCCCSSASSSTVPTSPGWCATSIATSSSTSIRTSPRSNTGCCSCGWASAATCAWWATSPRPSTPSRGRPPVTWPILRESFGAPRFSSSSGTIVRAPRSSRAPTRLSPPTPRKAPSGSSRSCPRRFPLYSRSTGTTSKKPRPWQLRFSSCAKGEWASLTSPSSTGRTPSRRSSRPPWGGRASITPFAGPSVSFPGEKCAKRWWACEQPPGRRRAGRLPTTSRRCSCNAGGANSRRKARAPRAKDGPRWPLCSRWPKKWSRLAAREWPSSSPNLRSGRRFRLRPRPIQ